MRTDNHFLNNMELTEAISLINRLFPEPHASLLSGMLFGVKRSMPEALYRSLLDSGTIHVVALSGMNISIIVRLVFDMLGKFFGKYIAGVITLCVIGWFIFLVGASSTIVRAAIMGSLSLLSRVLGRKDIPLLTLVLAAGTMILIEPSVIGDISFQLSCAATLGILIFSDSTIHGSEERGLISHIRLIARFIKEGIVSDLKITLSAQLFTIPLIMYYFQRISLVSPVANIAVGWLVAPITILGLITVTFGLVWFPLGKLCSFVVYPFLMVFIFLVRLFSLVPFSAIEFG